MKAFGFTMALLFAPCMPLFAQEAAEEAVAEVGVGGSDFHKNDITYSMEIETPHVEWATKLADGPINGFFIPSVAYGRDMVEIMQRVDVTPTTVSIDRNWDTNCWGIGDYYGHNERGDRDDYEVVYGYVEKDITGDAEFEVMVIPGLNGWSRMTRATRDAILKRVQDGAGLVLIHPVLGDVKARPFKGDEAESDIRIWDISPLVGCPDDVINEGGYPERNADAITTGKWEIAKKHYITEGLDLSLIPEGITGGKFYKYDANGEVLVKSGEYPIIAVKNYGKGRVVGLAYFDEGWIPESVDPIDAKIYWPYSEYYYSLLTRSILWAAGRDSGVSIESAKVTAGDALDFSLSLHSKDTATLDITAEGMSESGQKLPSIAGRMEVAPGAVCEYGMTIDLAGPLPGGKGIYDIIVKDAETGATLNWCATSVEIPKRATVTAVNPSDDVYKRGDRFSATVAAEGDLEGLTLRVNMADDLERLLATSETAASESTPFTAPLDDFLGKYVFLTAQLVAADGSIVDQLRAKPVLVVQSQRRPKEFKALVSFGGGRPQFKSTRMQIVRAAGADTGFTWGGTVNNSLDIPKGSFGIYWYHRGPTDPAGIDEEIRKYEETGDLTKLPYLSRKELYSRTKDKALLARTPCFHDPEFMGELARTVGEAAASKARYNLDYYFVGDEGSLTSYTDPFDYCWSEWTLAEFRRWLFGEYGSIEALNAEWKTDFENWETVAPLTTEEALSSGNFAPWADHRTFMEITFAHAYQSVRDAVVSGDPDGHIAVSGTQSTKSWNGCDWYRLDQVIDDFLSYGGGNQWDLHRSFAKPGSMIGYWTGYGSHGIAVQNAIWTAAIHNVLYPNIFWMYSYLDPDFTLSMSARDMGTAFKELKFEGVAKLFMESERRHDGIAVHFSLPSQHAASITYNEPERGYERDQVNRNFSGDRDGWVRTIKDLGMQFEFVSYDQLKENGPLDSGDYKVFVLPMSMALSTEEVAAIRRFVEKGGVLIADAAAGLMNDHCTWQDKGLVDDLFGIAAPASRERVLGARGGAVEVTSDGEAWGLSADKLDGIEAIETGLVPTTAKVLVTIGGENCVFVNDAGQGKAILLNVLFDRLGGGRRRRGEESEDKSPAYRSLVNAVLAKVGVSPEIEALTADGARLDQAMLARYRIGDAEILAVVKANVGTEGMDGVTYYDDSDIGRVARQAVTIRLPKKCYVTDVRTGERFGFTEVVKTDITVGGALVLAASPVENTVTLEGPAEAVLGEHPAFAIASKDASMRVARCHFTGPDGAFIPAYAKNIVVTGGKAAVVLPSALSDMPGEYTLEVTDLSTGATATATVTLQ